MCVSASPLPLLLRPLSCQLFPPCTWHHGVVPHSIPSRAPYPLRTHSPDRQVELEIHDQLAPIFDDDIGSRDTFAAEFSFTGGTGGVGGGTGERRTFRAEVRESVAFRALGVSSSVLAERINEGGGVEVSVVGEDAFADACVDGDVDAEASGEARFWPVSGNVKGRVVLLPNAPLCPCPQRRQTRCAYREVVRAAAARGAAALCVYASGALEQPPFLTDGERGGGGIGSGLGLAGNMAVCSLSREDAVVVREAAMSGAEVQLDVLVGLDTSTIQPLLLWRRAGTGGGGSADGSDGPEVIPAAVFQPGRADDGVSGLGGAFANLYELSSGYNSSVLLPTIFLEKMGALRELGDALLRLPYQVSKIPLEPVFFAEVAAHLTPVG